MSTGSGSKFTLRTSKSTLKTSHQNPCILWQKIKLWAKSASSDLHLSQIGETLGKILYNLFLEKCNLCRTLNWPVFYFNIFLNAIYSCNSKTEFSAAITSIFSVRLSSEIWCSRNYIFVEKVILLFFRILFCNNIKVLRMNIVFSYFIL